MKNLAWWCLALLVIALFGRLSAWQWSRGLEKEQLLRDHAASLARREPLPFSKAQDQGPPQRVQVRGVFVDAPAVLLDNQRRGEQVGVRAYRLFRSDEGGMFLVDLGWLALPGDRRLPNIDVPESRELHGLWMTPPSAGFALGPAFDHQGERVLATRLPMDELAALLNLPLRPRVLRLGPEAAIGYQRDLDPLPNTLTPEKHRGYAVQWAGLAIATFLIALILQFRRRRHDPDTLDA